MRLKNLLIVVSLCLSSLGVADSDAEFSNRLEKMLENVDKSIKILRQQITKNQTAPFIADLYLQLGDLLGQKANAYYYLYMERQREAESSNVTSVNKLTPVVNAQKEAAVIYQRVLDEYPEYKNRAEVLYRLVLTHQALEQNKKMFAAGERLIREFSADKQAMQARIILGRTSFESGDYPGAKSYLQPVSTSRFVFEKNSARHWLGLVAMQEGDFKGALHLFEQVVRDKELEEPEENVEHILKKGRAQENVRREALEDAVRAFTQVYKKDPKPLVYFSDLVPSEELYLFAIEKLAYRYIYLKKYQFAVGLLMTLSESTSDPQKVINTWQDVLLLVPVKERAKLPPQQVKFFIKRFIDWKSHYDIPAPVLASAETFFEKQVRDMATRSHSWGKKEKNKDLAQAQLQRARELYLLYLGVFGRSEHSFKMAVNLGDVYFRLKNYLRSGDFYLRAYKGEFGRPHHKLALLKNAVIALQKDIDSSYYDQIRARGLLTASIRNLFKHDSRWKRSARLNFTLAKAYYELGFAKKGLGSLYVFIQRFPQSKYAASAGELILDYYNIRDDLRGLSHWSKKLLALEIPNKKFNDRVKMIMSSSMTRSLDKKILEQRGYDAFSEAKTYLNAAKGLSNSSMADVALKKALQKSQSEGDFDTFLDAASAMAESDPSKRVSIWNSMASEAYRVGRFYKAIDVWKKVMRSSAGVNEKQEAFSRALGTAAMLKDFALVEALVKVQGAEALPEQVKAQVVAALEEPIVIPTGLIQRLLRTKLSDNDLAVLTRSQYQFSGAARESLLHELERRCQADPTRVHCQWLTLTRLDKSAERFKEALQRAPADLAAMEREAQLFAQILGKYQKLQDTPDAVLAQTLSLRIPSLYRNFAAYMKKIAASNPDVAGLLQAKVKESLKLAAKVRGSCVEIMHKSNLISPINRYCQSGKEPRLEQALQWKHQFRGPASVSAAKIPGVKTKQRQVFLQPAESEPMLELAYEYYKKKQWALAFATASLGKATHQGQDGAFSEIAGCSLVEMKYLNEARYHLQRAESRYSIKEGCEAKRLQLGAKL